MHLDPLSRYIAHFFICFPYFSLFFRLDNNFYLFLSIVFSSIYNLFFKNETAFYVTVIFICRKTSAWVSLLYSLPDNVCHNSSHEGHISVIWLYFFKLKPNKDSKIFKNRISFKHPGKFIFFKFLFIYFLFISYLLIWCVCVHVVYGDEWGLSFCICGGQRTMPLS